MKNGRSVCRVLTLFIALWGVSASGQQVPSQAALDETVKVYCSAWSEPNAEHRLELLEKVWASDGTYTDPLSHVEGREALVEILAH